MSMMFGTVSYLPDNDTRNKRRERSIKVFRNYGKYAKLVNQPLHIVTTNWHEEEWQECVDACSKDGIVLNRIMCYSIGLGASVAKNTLLTTFYNTDCDYLFMGDDDCLTYPYYDLDKFIIDIHNDPSRFIKKKVYCFTSYRAHIFPYKKSNLYDVDFTDNYVFTYKNIGCFNGPFILANSRKYFGKDVLSRGYEGKHRGYRDDLSIVAEMLKIGIVPYTSTCFIGADLDLGRISTLHKPEENGTHDYMELLNKEFLQKYPKATITSQGYPNLNNYLPIYFRKRILVPRSIPYTFIEQDIPKDRGKKKYIVKGLIKK